MAKKSARAAQDYLRLGFDMLSAGDTETAVKALRVAVADMPRNPEARLGLAQALRQQGNVGEAAIVLSEALAIPPVSVDAARLLSVLLQRFQLEEPDDLRPAGLRAALSFSDVDRQPIVRTALDWLKRFGVLKEPIARGRADGWNAVAEGILADRKGTVIRDRLLQDGLAAGFNSDAEIEHLLTAVRRRVLLDVSDADLLRNKDLFQFALALVAQLGINEHVWATAQDEIAARDSLEVDLAGLVAGSVEAAPGLVKLLLYRPARELPIAAWGADVVARLRPKALAALVAPMIVAHQEEGRIAEGIKSFNSIEDETSKRVAGQYEKSPYPRWSSLNTQAPPVRLDEIGRVFGTEISERLRAGPFDVLVAGSGTGHHAAQIAVAYGHNARILGVDLSRASLAYAQRMAAHYGLANLTFAQADLLDAKAIGQTFDVVECIGVLHHMADPFAGWRSVLGLLKPGGLMFVGLYSAEARKALAELRRSADYPGPGCSDDAARAYRATLFGRDMEDGSTPLHLSQDFYTLSDFRDLVLHESEIQLTLEEISRFLNAEDLEFRGFNLDPQTLNRFSRVFPDDALPGTLANWTTFERANPRTFEGMYNFWCRKRG
jgi:SAM-dependent methyltransferase